MAFPIIGGSQSGGYLIDNSIRFNDGDSARLSATQLSGSTTTWTFSCWLKRSEIGQQNSIFTVGSSNTNDFLMYFSGTADTIDIIVRNSSTINGRLNTNAVFRDASAWYHIVFTYDSTNATSSERMRLYINGERVTSFSTETYPSLNQISVVNNSSYTMHISSIRGGADYFDGYMAEINHIDGQALSPTDFGEFDSDSGIWKPIRYSGSYGTNGFYLDFENSGSLGADQSGNGNNWTPTNLASTDQTTDTPTNNFCTLNPLSNAMGGTLSEGNLQIVSNGSDKHCFSTFGLTSGKWYFEVKDISQGGQFKVFALTDADHNDTTPGTNHCHIIFSTGATSTSGTVNSNAGAMTTGDILAVAINLDDGEVYFTKNGNIDTGLTAQATGISISGRKRDFRISAFESSGTSTTAGFNFGNPSFSISSGNTDDNGYGNFEYAPPSGYLALCTQNLATELSPTIDDGSQYFDTLLYTGDGTTRDITGMNFKPDLLWVKRRSSTLHHRLWDTTRGAGYQLYSSLTNAEAYDITAMSSFLSDGFSIPSGSLNNTTSETYVAWHWKASGGSTSSNTSGSITSTVQANPTVGFSIVTYTGTGSAGTVGHGLGVVPDMVIVKNRSSSVDWGVQMANTLGFTNALRLNLTDAYGGANGFGWWNDTAPTSTTVSIGTRSEVNTNGNNYVMYCFNNVEGYSKFGKYTGNGSTDGPFVYTGFRPAWVMVRRTDTTADWHIDDATRNTFNPTDARLDPNSAGAESSSIIMHDFTSNGFKTRTTSADWNGSGGTFIYMAFAENPFVTSGAVPVTAR